MALVRYCARVMVPDGDVRRRPGEVFEADSGTMRDFVARGQVAELGRAEHGDPDSQGSLDIETAAPARRSPSRKARSR